MKATDSITDHMTTRLITFTPEVMLKDAIKILVKNKISGAPVVNQTGQLIGMLSERDCIRTILDGNYNQRPIGEGSVGDYMSSDVKTLEADINIIEVAYQFVNSTYKRFPVLRDGKLVGQISRSDVLKVINTLMPNVNRVPSSWTVAPPE